MVKKIYSLLLFCLLFLSPTGAAEETPKDTEKPETMVLGGGATTVQDEDATRTDPDGGVTPAVEEEGSPEVEKPTAGVSANETSGKPEVQNPAEESRIKLSEQIREIIRNYREYGEVIIPGVDLPDPMPVDDISKSFAGTPMNFTNVKVYGLSKFAVDHVNTDLDKKQFFVALKMKRLLVLGNYSVQSWLSKAAGPFNITLMSVEATGAAELGRDADGNLRATDFEMDMNFKDAKVDLKNLGMMGGLLQGMISSMGPIIFEAVKPTLLRQITTIVEEDVNSRITIIGKKFKSMDNQRPLDLAVFEGRKYIQLNGYDPYHLRDYVLKENIFTINISHFWIAGLSRFYRVGEVSLSMDSGMMQLGFRLATEKLHGNCRWMVRISEEFWKTGVTNFTIKSLQVKVLVNQSLDVSRHPVIHDLDLHIGTPQITVDRTGKLDLFIEAMVNSLPVMLRHMIVDALEEPIKAKAQEVFDTLNVQEMLDKHLPVLDEMNLRK